MPDKLVVELAARLVGDWPTPIRQTHVDLVLENATGRLSVENLPGEPCSSHRFTVKDATDVGFGDVHGLDDSQACHILAISCSLSHRDILFAPARHAELRTSVVPGEAPSSADIKDTGDGRKQIFAEDSFRISERAVRRSFVKAKLDESRVLALAGRLLAVGAFCALEKRVVPSNTKAATQAYCRAMRSTDPEGCYESLYTALEKAVNADDPQRDRADFEAEAARLTDLDEKDIKELRLFANRLKHPIRSGNDIAFLEAGRKELPRLLANLKRAADRAIQYRLRRGSTP